MNKNLLLNFYGVFETIHYLEGRVRYRIPSIVGSIEQKKILQENFLKMPFIKEININLLLGTILIKYDKNIIDIQMLSIILINILGLEKELEKRKVGCLSRELKKFFGVINNSIFSKSKGILDLKSIIAITFIVGGYIRYKTNPAIPNGINLLWWGFRYLEGGEK